MELNMKLLLVMMSVLMSCSSCTADVSYPIGACPEGASVYNTDPALAHLKFCSFTGDSPADGLCMQRVHMTVCLPLCNRSAAKCDAGEQVLTFDGVCYCNAPL